MTDSQTLNRGHWLTLGASFLGWMFDGVEIGLFPVVVRPALQSLGLADDTQIAWWISIVVAAFLLGAALGGIVFGWLGDKIGRVRAMVISILIYSLFTGACAFAQVPWHLGIFRFIASLGMGGEWALAVALVMECWPERHRPRLAGAIGAAANFGFLFIAVVALIKPVTADSWRWLMLVGAAPALLALLISLLVPESERWKESVKAAKRDITKRPAIMSLLPHSPWVAYVIGLAVGVIAVLVALVWIGRADSVALLATKSWPLWIVTRLVACVAILGLVCAGGLLARRPGWFLPIALLAIGHAAAAWLYRGDGLLILFTAAFVVGILGAPRSVQEVFSPRLFKTTLCAIVFSAIPLIGTWAAVSGFIPTWVDQLCQIKTGADYLDGDAAKKFDQARDPKEKLAVLNRALTKEQRKEIGLRIAPSKAWVQVVLAIGAIIGCFIAPIVGGVWGRRPVYFTLCLISLLSCAYLFRFLPTFNLWFIAVVGLVGGVTAAFYGWLPLYLPELFPTRVRATGQGLSFNFGRILAAFGAFYTGHLVALFGGDYGKAMGAITLVYVVGMVVIWLAPETKGKPLPE